MYIETSQKNSGSEHVFASFERRGVFQSSNITFSINYKSILANDSLRSVGRFRLQLLVEDNTWSIRYNIAKNDN